MQITYNHSDIKKFADMIFSHDFNKNSYLFGFRDFEVPNLSDDMKDAFLSKLNVSNPEGIPAFETFWSWVLANYGDDLAKQYCENLYPDIKVAHRHLFAMIDNHSLKDWTHIKARVYRKWCSIATEAQCTYAVLRGINKLQKNWAVISSPKLDGLGIDLAVVTEEKAIPLQIKKDTNSKFAQHKHNHLANFSRITLSSKAKSTFERSLTRFHQKPVDMMIVKYGLANKQTKLLPYDYLVEAKNKFVYFDGEKIVSHLQEAIA